MGAVALPWHQQRRTVDLGVDEKSYMKHQILIRWYERVLLLYATRSITVLDLYCCHTIDLRQLCMALLDEEINNTQT